MAAAECSDELVSQLAGLTVAVVNAGVELEQSGHGRVSLYTWGRNDLLGTGLIRISIK